MEWISGEWTMQLEIQPKTTICRIAGKEITLFFSSLIGYLFLGAFAGVTLFVFFWGDSFFARNIADVRPMFEGLPIILIFLCAALTMRLWSEERRAGTLEYVLTQPVPLWHFVAGKFASCMFLLLVALAITLPLPISVSIIGNLDWGPVLAGYLATLLMGAAYLSIGLFVSSKSDNQIVSLISTCALCGIFYLLGSPVITDLLGNRAGELLRLLGSGSRFESITRGVIDLRDLYYYISITLVFLALNVLVLEKERWSQARERTSHKQWLLITALVVANALVANLWLGQLTGLRIDVTRGNQYTMSKATEAYLSQLQEPLLIRGYFSSKTHPLLAPLVPQLRDLISEYKIAGHGKVRVEFVDPIQDPELEKEANEKYGITPVPFQVADRYQSSIVSSYFNVLVQYGDQYQVLGFRDLIEVQATGESDIDVQLRNPEYDLTRAIKKVINSYQSGGNLFDTVHQKLTLNAYVSVDNALPQKLQTFKADIKEVAAGLQKQAGGRFSINVINPDVDGGKVAKQIEEDYGFKPMTTNIFSDQQFYFYLTVTDQNQVVEIPLGDLSKESFKRNLESGIKRFASGFTKTVALVSPAPQYSPYGDYGQSGPSFSQLSSFLGTDLNVEREDLSDGSVSGNADILVLAAPENLDDNQLFAVDQFLMKGGTVVVATSPFSTSLTSRSFTMQKHHSGLEKWLQHNGLEIDDKLVLDSQNSAFPVPVTRTIQGFQFQEMQMLDYPYFVDVRGDGLNRKNMITSELPQATIAWASPIKVLSADKAVDTSGRKITELLHSSGNAWLNDSLDIMPRAGDQGASAFSPSGKRGPQLLGVVSQGHFDSYFAGKSSPLLKTDNGDEAAAASGTTAKTGDEDKSKQEPALQIGSVIEQSPESARIILFSSNDFLQDQVIRLEGSAQQTQYQNTLQMMANAVDWSLEDDGLLSIRSRGHFNLTLPPMERGAQMLVEYLNEALAVIAILIIALIVRKKRQAKFRRYFDLLAN